jgi:hypothetical protein
MTVSLDFEQLQVAVGSLVATRSRSDRTRAAKSQRFLLAAQLSELIKKLLQTWFCHFLLICRRLVAAHALAQVSPDKQAFCDFWAADQQEMMPG